MKFKQLLVGALALVGSLEAKASMNENHATFLQNIDWSVEYLTGSKSDFKDPAYHGKKLSYSEGEVSISYEEPAQPQKLSGMLDLGYLSTEIDWKDNPFFQQKRFNSYKVKLGCAYAFDEHWIWQAGGGADMQVSPFSLSNATNYSLFVWGRYAYDESRSFNIGVLSWLGLKEKKVYPIVGINYNYNKQWFVNLIFPMKGSVTYLFTEEFGTELGVRWSQVRRRLKKNENASKGIFEYSSSSLELAAFYNFPIGITVRGFLGAGIGTKLKVYNQSGKDEQKLKMKSPFFGGISAEKSF